MLLKEKLLLKDRPSSAIVAVRDIGDGLTTQDETSFAGDFGATCATTVIPDANFEAVLDGDFQTMIRTK